MSDSSRVTARLDPQHEKNLVLTNCLIPQKSPEFVSTWRPSHVTRWRSFKLFASVHNKQRSPPVKETETWVKSKQNIWSLSLLNHSRPQISPLAPKILCLQRKKKTQVVLSENTKHFHFSHEWGEKKPAPNMNSAASFLLSVRPQTGTLNSFGGWWVRSVTWWLEEDVRVTERVTQRWHLRCNAVHSELLSDARQTLHTNKFWQRTSSRTSWWQRLKSFQSNVWEQQFSGQWAAFIAGTKVELWSHSFVFWYLRGFLCVWNDYFQFRLARKNMKWIKGRSRDRQEKNLVEQWNNVFCLCRQNSLLILC